MRKAKAGLTALNIVLSTAIVLGLISCAARKKTENFDASSHNSRNSLDWDGIYIGNLLCADCEGQQTVIRIKKDLSYAVQTKYLGKSDSVYESSRIFTWNDEGSKIMLKSIGHSGWPATLLVGENALFWLDSNGNRIIGELADRYVLRKVHPGILEKYWKLVELNGKPVVWKEGIIKEPHIILKIKGGRIIGHGGCNSFSGNYELKDMNRLRFSKIVSTKMACLNMEIETQLFKMLEAADNYVLKSDTLILNKARMAPLARFEVVYLR